MKTNLSKNSVHTIDHQGQDHFYSFYYGILMKLIQNTLNLFSNIPIKAIKLGGEPKKLMQIPDNNHVFKGQSIPTEIENNLIKTELTINSTLLH